MSVKWGNTISTSFKVTNGVKQGGVLSPLLFNLYTDDLSSELIKCNIGCHLGGKILNHIAYADDLCLLSISSNGMQKLLDICENYAYDHDIIYNSKKTVSMFFKPKLFKNTCNPLLQLCNNDLVFVEKCKYLGVHVETETCKADVKRQLCKFYANANMLLRKFHFCSDNVKVQLFKSYCTTLYCSQFWYNCSKTFMKKLSVGYNNSFRRLMKLDKYCSASGMFVYYGVPSFGELQRKLIVNFIDRIQSSSNSIIMNVVLSSIPLYSSIWNHWYSSLHCSTL